MVMRWPLDDQVGPRWPPLVEARPRLIAVMKLREGNLIEP